MTNREKTFYLNRKPIGYWSACGGIEVKDIQYGFEDYLIVVANAWNGKRSVHKVKVNYSTKLDREYIELFGHRYHLADCLVA